MAGEAIVLDPVSDDSTNVELALSAANGYYLLEHAYPVPNEDVLWAGGVDVEGQRRAGASVQNREIPIRLRLRAAADAAFRSAQRNLDKKLAKLRAEGGTYKRTLPNGDVIVYDVETVTGGERLFDNRFIANLRTEDTLTFICRPYGRGTTQLYAAVTESTLPVLRFLAAGVKGDVAALGRLVFDELQGQDQWWLHWGLRQRWYSTDADNALFYEAESRTPLGGAATAAGTAPASGGGSNVVRQGTLTGAWQAMLSTQASGGGNHLKNIGVYEIWARAFMPTSNTGAVSIRLDWAEGDFRRYTNNPAVTFAANHSREGKWVLVNLGQVFLSKVAQGTQRWEGRIVAKSTVAGDDLDVDCFWLRPMSEGNGTARALLQFETPTSFTARDEFDHAAGALAGKVAPVGGTWSGAGDTDDFTINTTDHEGQRTAVSDADLNTGRYARLGSGTAAAVAVEGQFDWHAVTSDGTHRYGVLARYTDVNNWLMGVQETDFTTNPRTFYWRVIKRVAGTVTTLASLSMNPLRGPIILRLLVDAAGRFWLWSFNAGATSSIPLLVGRDVDLATGGALASGGYGIYDAKTSAGALDREFENVGVWTPAADAAVFANQSLEIRHDRVIREDSAGTIWTPVSDYEADYLRIPPAGVEGRTSEILVKGSRNDPDWGDDPAIDDGRVTLEITPLYWRVPDDPDDDMVFAMDPISRAQVLAEGGQLYANNLDYFDPGGPDAALEEGPGE